ncbi:MAG: glycosyltransferase [Phycisphaerae bacterium]
MKISFCSIVFNEAPTLRAHLEHLYPHAHQLIVCEGSIQLLRRVAGAPLRSDDGTLDLLHEFYDPDRKLHVIQRDWRDKNQMAVAYAELASGDLIWHVDADEFYDTHSLEAIPVEFDDPDLFTLNVPMYVFWKSPDFVLANEHGQDRWFRYARVLRRTPGMSVQHLPIRRLVNGRVDTLGMRDASDPRITAYHYAWNHDDRVRLKMQLYARRDGRTTRPDWLAQVWDRWTPDCPNADWPDGVHPSTLWRLWPRRFTGRHPHCVQGLLDRFDLLTPAGRAV